MKNKLLLLKISFTMLLLIAAFHTFFIIIGGPSLPTTPEFVQMREWMQSLQVDAGAGIMRTTQDFMNGFNIIASIFLFSLPLLGLLLIPELKHRSKGLNKLAIISLLSVLAFSITSFLLLAIGGSVLSALVCCLLALSMLIKPNQNQSIAS